jgi:uncharacterized protein YjbJ (UPF0337 family)
MAFWRAPRITDAVSGATAAMHGEFAVRMPRHTGGGQKEASMNKDQVEGMAKQAKGAVKDAAGAVVGSDKMQAEGKMDKAEGKIQKGVGDAKKTVADAVEK